MQNINNKINQIYLLYQDIISDVLKYDLSGDQIDKIQDKKNICIRNMFNLKDTISDYIK